MKVHTLTYPIASDVSMPPSAMAIGYFDGVHRGHSRVIQRAIDMARAKNLKSAVMTFDPHPREVLGNYEYTRYLTPLPEKQKLLEKMGVDLCYVVHFDIAFASVYPEDFINEMIVPLQAKHVIVGFDYTFGYRGAGTSQTLEQYKQGRYDLDVIAPVNRYGEKVSSTVIRNYLHHGEVEHTTRFLGRPYLVRGKVVHGEARGRTIGFPTANIQLDQPYFIPKNGVYAVTVNHNEKTYHGVMNIGIKPTFENERKEKSLEVHIFDLDEDLYDQELEVAFHYFIREEQKFAGVDDLIHHIKQDVQEAKQRLEG